MKKLALPIIIAIALLGTLIVVRSNSDLSSTPTSSTTTDSTTTSPTTATTSVSTPYKDGSYTGSAVDVGYGIVQVKAVIAGGKIADVKFLQMPNDRQHSVEISNLAGPQLRQETLSAQSGNVDIVSGATSTSEGYIQSIQNALNQAKT